MIFNQDKTESAEEQFIRPKNPIKICNLPPFQLNYNGKIFTALSFLLIWTVLSSGYAQNTDSLFNRAVFYYENAEFTLACRAFTDLVKIDPADHRAFYYRANCYMETGQYELAKADYLVALRSGKTDDLIYNLGNAYESLSLYDSARWYFHQYRNLQKDKPDGSLRLCMLFLEPGFLNTDSALHYASEVVEKNPENPFAYQTLALAYYAADQYNKALESALKGLEKDPFSFPLNRMSGICYFMIREYDSALEYFKKASELDPDDLTTTDYRIQTLLYKNTDPEKTGYNADGRIVFSGFTSLSLKKAENMIERNPGTLSYEVLLNTFHSDPLKMGIDDFFFLYLGHTLQKDYSPYERSYNGAYNTAELLKLAGDLEEALLKDPTDFPIYLNLADLYLDLGNRDKYFEYRFKYFGFLEAIRASGNGNSPEEAFIVNRISHEYEIMSDLGLRVISQSLVKEKKHYFDILVGSGGQNAENEVFFNIDRPYSTLMNLPKNH